MHATCDTFYVLYTISCNHTCCMYLCMCLSVNEEPGTLKEPAHLSGCAPGDAPEASGSKNPSRFIHPSERMMWMS